LGDCLLECREISSYQHYNPYSYFHACYFEFESSKLHFPHPTHCWANHNPPQSQTIFSQVDLHYEPATLIRTSFTSWTIPNSCLYQGGHRHPPHQVGHWRSRHHPSYHFHLHHCNSFVINPPVIHRYCQKL
jgi:hypothetical protein